jgi:hypothetical protein
MITRPAYFGGVPLWRGTVRDELHLARTANKALHREATRKIVVHDVT